MGGSGLRGMHRGVVFSGDGCKFRRAACARSEGCYGSLGPMVRLCFSLMGPRECIGGGNSHQGDLTTKRSPELGSQISDVRLRRLGDSGSLGGCSGISWCSLETKEMPRKAQPRCWSEEILFYRCGWWLQTVGSDRIWQRLVRMLVGDLIEEMDGMCGWMIQVSGGTNIDPCKPMGG